MRADERSIGVNAGFLEYRDRRQYAGAGLFVSTDGITEALNVASELFSEERLEEALRSLAAASASEAVAGVMERVRTFAATAVQADDIAAMGLRFVK